ncbi:MAG: hypothetical protein ACJ71Z_03860 [Aeromicrobium sp.]
MAVYAVRMPDIRELLSAFNANPMLAWVTGAFTLLLGLTIVALHNYWKGAAAIIVSVMGWLTTAKGFAIMACPGIYRSAADTMAGHSGLFYVDAVVVGLVGLYLTYVGWVRRD